MPRLTSDVQAFEARATDADLDDLRARLAAARLPKAETVYRAAPGPRRWEQGVPLADLAGVYPRDIEKCPRPWAQQRYRQIVRWRSPETGGHFPSLEVPEYFVKDLQEGLAAVLAASR
jgi:hypothetical protein